MGKRRKRLTMAKYAKKYATVRHLIAEKRQPEPELEMPAVEQVIEELTPVLEAAQEEIETAPELVAEDATPEPEPVVVEPEPTPAPAPKRKTRAGRKPRKAATPKKTKSPDQSE